MSGEPYGAACDVSWIVFLTLNGWVADAFFRCTSPDVEWIGYSSMMWWSEILNPANYGAKILTGLLAQKQVVLITSFIYIYSNFYLQQFDRSCCFFWKQVLFGAVRPFSFQSVKRKRWNPPTTHLGKNPELSVLQKIDKTYEMFDICLCTIFIHTPCLCLCRGST